MSESNEVRLWLVGKVNPENHKEWEFQGVFSSETKAVTACRDKWYFMGPAVLNKALPHESVDWIGAYYPMWRD